MFPVDQRVSGGQVTVIQSCQQTCSLIKVLGMDVPMVLGSYEFRRHRYPRFLYLSVDIPRGYFY